MHFLNSIVNYNIQLFCSGGNNNRSGGKYSKEQITLLERANMDGSEKLTLLMILKFQIPRYLENVKRKPLNHRENEKSWISANLFEAAGASQRMLWEKKNIILFIDNCTFHGSIPKMENIKLTFYLPNMTSFDQPMDQGIVKILIISIHNLLSSSFIDKKKRTQLFFMLKYVSNSLASGCQNSNRKLFVQCRIYFKKQKIFILNNPQLLKGLFVLHSCWKSQMWYLNNMLLSTKTLRFAATSQTEKF